MPIVAETAETFRNFTRLGDRPIGVIEHSMYGRLWAPSDLEEFSRVIDHLAWQSPGGWRGHAELEWGLHSGAGRRVGLSERPATEWEAEVASYEHWLLDRARMEGWGSRNGRPLGDLELLGVLQHHGAATRLLDFTRSVYVALWFAARAQPESWGLLLGLDLEDVWAVRSPELLRHSFSELLGAAGDRLSLWHPSALSPRMPAQSGFFLWGRTSQRPWGSIGPAPTGDPAARPVSRSLPTFLCVAVSPALKASMDLQAASMFGYSEETLFPDFDGFAAAHSAKASLGTFKT